jgi:phosphate acetyltransferase
LFLLIVRYYYINHFALFKNFPMSWIILTGNLTLPESIKNLLKGLDTFGLQILTTIFDTYQAATKIEGIKAKISSTSERKIALGMGLFFDNIDTALLLSKLDTLAQPIMTPVMFEYTLFEKARANKKTIVLPEGEDERILRATEIILHRGIANIILLGNPDEIAHHAGILGLDISKATIINPDTSPLLETFSDAFYRMRQHKGLQLPAAQDAMVHTTYFGTMLVHQGFADGMVSGATHTTADTIRPALQIIKTKPEVSIVSSLFFMCLDTKVLVYGDCAVNQNPNEHELAQIAISCAKTAKAFDLQPRVAMLSYSTGESGSGEDVEKVKMATRIAKEIQPDLLIEGPIQYDAAVDCDVASLKLPESKVAGKANVFIFPDLNTGNNTYKAVQRSSGAIAIGPILQGLNKPINDLSRGCTLADIVNTVAITAIQASQS